MRKIIFTIAAAATALVVASPAAAQYGYGVPTYGAPVYGGQAYGAPYGNAYGYRQGGQHWARELQQIRYEANNLARQGRLTRAESRDLFRDIQSAERAVYRKGRYGLTRNEARDLNDRVYRIQRELRRYADYDGRRYRRW
jgi:hypothetical protein